MTYFKKGGRLCKACIEKAKKAKEGASLDDIIANNKRRYPGITDDQAAGRAPIRKNGKDYYLGGDGVLGGLETEVTEKTTTIVLEAACFNGPSIRRTSRGCGLHSEASGRFERGTDVTGTIRALDRAAQLLQDMGACTVTQGVVDVYPTTKEPVHVKFTPEQINNRLGTDLPAEKMIDILKKLYFKVSSTISKPSQVSSTFPRVLNHLYCLLYQG